jgi:hypothetical protein
MAGIAFAGRRLPGGLALLVVMGLVFLAGCSGPSEVLVPVTGTITVKKQPLANGTVVFHPDPEKGNKEKREPRATITSDRPGVCQLTTDNREGAPAGWYKVTVHALEPAASSLRPPQWLAHPRYADVKTSGLSVEVRKDAPGTAYDFDLEPPG